MTQTLNFSVANTSPTISYFPFADIFPVNLSAGWNTYFSDSGFPKFRGETGNGTSFHVTSHDQAALSIIWRGTGIQVLGSAQGNLSYNIILDGSVIPHSPPKGSNESQIIADITNITDNNKVHNLTLSTALPAGNKQGTFFFDSAVIYFDTTTSSSPDRHRWNASFRGGWAPSSINNVQFYQSQTKDDVASIKFNGTSFLLRGVTSPTAGKYSVVLDNVPSFLNGRSSSTNPDTLLFYATGLDPTILHDVQIKNEDGSDLLLEVGKLQVLETRTQPTPTPSPGSTAGDSKGTIAAFILAGILGFLIISGFLYFFFVIRPERHREKLEKLARMEMYKKAQEGGPLGAFKVSPTVFPDDMEIGSQEGTLGHHQKQSSGRSGFTRWKREVEGGFGNLGILGLTFRHSGSTGRRSGRSRASGRRKDSAKSSIFTLSSLFTLSSSARSHGKGKKKAKPNQVSDSSWSSTFALQLPVKRDFADKSNERDAGPSHFSLDRHLSASDVHTLSYMNTPSPKPALVPAPVAPSHSVLGLKSNSHSVPSSVPPHPSLGRLLTFQNPGYRDGIGLGLNYDNPKSNALEDINQSYSPFPASISLLPAPDPLSALAPRDRGSAQYSSDDAGSYLGSAATRLAIRSLRPRTAQSPDAHPPIDQVEIKSRMGTLANIPKLDEPIPAQLIRPPSSVEVQSGKIPPGAALGLPHNIYLEISPPSTFRVDLPGNLSRASSHFEPPTIARSLEEGRSEQRQVGSTVFRLTPTSNVPYNNGGSFLNLEASPNMLYRSQSIASSVNSAENGHVEQSRWSTSVSQASDLSPSWPSNLSVPATSPVSNPTSCFPYPVSLPSSSFDRPEGDVPFWSAQAHPTTIPHVPHIERGQADNYLAKVLRSSEAFGSPIDSVPVSVTQRRPRHSGSTRDSGSGANSAPLPSHPPLHPK